MNEPLPAWLAISYRRVLGPFFSLLARSHGWKVIYLISPWISEFDEEAGMSLRQLLTRIVHDDTTVYLVTRPPVQEWHWDAVRRIRETGKAYIVFVEDLHTKLYCARTNQGEFALIGSANLTQHALSNREIGVLVRATGQGKGVVKELLMEAGQIYRAKYRLVHSTRTAWRK